MQSSLALFQQIVTLFALLELQLQLHIMLA